MTRLARIFRRKVTGINPCVFPRLEFKFKEVRVFSQSYQTRYLQILDRRFQHLCGSRGNGWPDHRNRPDKTVQRISGNLQQAHRKVLHGLCKRLHYQRSETRRDRLL